jgi:pilus assembly protein Flp/PilA
MTLVQPQLCDGVCYINSFCLKGDIVILGNKSNNTMISENLMVADTYLKRLKGLMFSKKNKLCISNKKIILRKEISMLEDINIFALDEEGQGIVEYGLILGLIVVGAIAIMATMGGKITNMFNKVNNAIH